MDALVIFSDSWEEHRRHFREVFQTLREAGLTANPSKCQWGGEQLEFLGHVVGKGVISVPQARAQAIGNYVKPKTKRGLRAFLGTVSYIIESSWKEWLSTCLQRCTPQGGMVKQHGGRLFTDL